MAIYQNAVKLRSSERRYKEYANCRQIKSHKFGQKPSLYLPDIKSTQNKGRTCPDGLSSEPR